MALSAFDDKKKKPKTAELRRVLGRSAAAWQALTEWLAGRFDPVVEEWVFAGKDWGWSLRIKHKKRAVVYLTPSESYFHVGLVLGEKAVAAAMKAGLPDSIAEKIETAKRYAEGRAVRLDVRFKKDLASVKRLADAKMTN